MDIRKLADDVNQIMATLTFPVQKADVVRHAEANGASSETLALLNQLPEQTYSGIDNVIQNLPIGNLAGELQRFL